MIVYLVTNLINGKHYIGKTIWPLKRRWRNHLGKVRQGVQTHLYSAIRKYGQAAFSVVPLVSILTTDPQLKEQERFWIRAFHSNERQFGYNMTAGGDGLENPSEETRRKIGEGQIGRPCSQETRRKKSEALKGRIPSAEQRRKNGDAHRGIKLSAEHRRKIGESKKGNTNTKGRRLSAEHCRKLGDAKRGKKLSPEHRRKIGEAGRGRTFTAERNRKISEAMKGNQYSKGRIPSAEHLRKISEAKFLKTVAWG